MRVLAGRAALAALCVAGAALLTSGCGAVDDAKHKAANAVRGKAAEQCRKQARDITDPQDRRDALKACDAIGSGDTGELRRRADG